MVSRHMLSETIQFTCKTLKNYFLPLLSDSHNQHAASSLGSSLPLRLSCILSAPLHSSAWQRTATVTYDPPCLLPSYALNHSPSSPLICTAGSNLVYKVHRRLTNFLGARKHSRTAHRPYSHTESKAFMWSAKH